MWYRRFSAAFALILFGVGTGGAVWVLVSETVFAAFIRSSDSRLAFPEVLALFFAFSAAGMSWQLVRSSRAGFVYCGVTDVVYREEEPRLYRVWCAAHLLIISFFVVSTAVFVRLALSG